MSPEGWPINSVVKNAFFIQNCKHHLEMNILQILLNITHILKTQLNITHV